AGRAAATSATSIALSHRIACSLQRNDQRVPIAGSHCGRVASVGKEITGCDFTQSKGNAAHRPISERAGLRAAPVPGLRLHRKGRKLMPPLSRRDLMKTAAAAGAVAFLPDAPAVARGRHGSVGWVVGHLTGAQAVVETLLQM